MPSQNSPTQNRPDFSGFVSLGIAHSDVTHHIQLTAAPRNHDTTWLTSQAQSQNLRIIVEGFDLGLEHWGCDVSIREKTQSARLSLVRSAQAALGQARVRKARPLPMHENPETNNHRMALNGRRVRVDY